MTAPIELGHDVLGAVLSTYVSRYPDVEIDVHLTDRHVNLIDEGFDLAIRVGPLVDTRLIARRLGGPQQLGIFASPGYTKANGMPKVPNDLKHHRCLVMSGTQNPTNWSFQIEGKLRSVPVTPYLTVNSFQVLRSVAIAGGGVVQLPMRHASAALAERQLRPVLAAFMAPPRVTLAVYPSARNVSPALRAMVETLVECFDEAPRRPGR